MSYLRFLPEEFRAIRQACAAVVLSGEFFAVFKYFLVESLRETQPDLTARICRFRRPELVLLYTFLRRQRSSTAPNRGQTRRAEQAYGLTSEELQAVRHASGPFFLYDGSLGSYQDFLLYSLGETRPRLTAKLARLDARQVAELYRRVKRRSRWNA